MFRHVFGMFRATRTCMGGYSPFFPTYHNIMLKKFKWRFLQMLQPSLYPKSGVQMGKWRSIYKWGWKKWRVEKSELWKLMKIDKSIHSIPKKKLRCSIPPRAQLAGFWWKNITGYGFWRSMGDFDQHFSDFWKKWSEISNLTQIDLGGGTKKEYGRVSRNHTKKSYTHVFFSFRAVWWVFRSIS